MGDEELVQIIAREVRARLSAGGAGAGYTRAASSSSQVSELAPRLLFPRDPISDGRKGILESSLHS